MKYFFYGDECSHCHTMLPIVDKLNAEGLEIQKLETWHNNDNLMKMKAIDHGTCGGVPFFYNDSSGKTICGEASEDAVREWAKS